MILTLLLMFSAHAQDPEPQVLDTKHKVIEKDWMSKIAIEVYGANEGPMLTPWLCTYNQTRGRIVDCDTILPGQEILLPPKSVLRCDVVRSLGYTCMTDDNDTVVARMIDTLPPEMQKCVATLGVTDPSVPGGRRIVLAKAISISLKETTGLTYTSPEYQAACEKMSVAGMHVFDTSSDYVTLDADGEILVVHFLGSTQ